MNVGELISLLSEMPAEADIRFFGDEYDFPVVGVTIDGWGEVVLR